MYFVFQAARPGPRLRLSGCGSWSRTTSSLSELQRLLDLNRRKRDTSEAWKRPPITRKALPKAVASSPFAGGLAQSKSVPFFMRDAVAAGGKPDRPAATATIVASAGGEPSKPSVGTSQPGSQPQQAMGGARFFFMGTGAGSTTAPSPVEPKARSGSILPPGPAAARFMFAGRSTAAATAAGPARSPDSRKADYQRAQDVLRRARDRSAPGPAARPGLEDSTSTGASQQEQKREWRRPSDATPVSEPAAGGRPRRAEPKKAEPKKADPKRAAPGRDRPKTRRVERGSEVGARDEDDGKKRRRKKLKLPKKGKEITLPLTITVDGLAKLLDVPNDHLMRKMAGIGMDKLASDYLLTNEEAADVALEYGVVPVIPEEKGPELYPRPVPEDMSAHLPRPPVVTIMGHVDHGKTTLLDTLRSSSITATEAGGITQHIGAFSVQMKDGQSITVLDTPGHAAFSAMRARGANATDIVVLVVAADDGVMPQTKEAIQHALDADVPIVVAVNKCDKPGVDPAQIREELLQYGIQTEDLGGDIQAVEISALKGDGVGELAESIATLAEVLDLRAEADGPVEATVIESQVEKGRGGVASVLVKRGTLRVGDVIVAGTTWCKVRGMADDRGAVVAAAGPGTAVKVMGWREVPHAGDMALQAETEAQAKEVVGHRVERRKKKAQLASIEAMNEKRRETHVREDVERAEEKAFQRAVWEYHQGIRSAYPEKPARAADQGAGAGAADKAGAVLEVPVVIKGDVSGTVEAVAAALKQLPSKKIRTSVLSAGVGPVTESDVAMAGSSEQGVVIAFNVKADKNAQNAAKRAHVQIMGFRIIYKLLEDVEKLLLSRLPPVVVEEVQGEAVVQEVFEITLKGSRTARIAGSRVMSGTVARAAKARVVRDGSVLFTGDISSLKNVKSDIAEATKGQEFGIGFAGFEDLREGDIVRSIVYKETPQKLE